MQKKFNLLTCFLLIIISICFLGSTNLSQVEAETSSTKEIIVYGSGKVTAVPDIAIINVGVENSDRDINTAVESNNQIMSDIIEYLKSLGINENDISTKNYCVYQRYNYAENEEFLGYQVDNSLEFKTTNFDNLSTILTRLTDLGANRLGGITFACSDLKSYYNEALKLALENAKSKCLALSEEELKICKIEEKSLFCNEIYRDSAIVLARANKESIAKGSLQIEAKIEVTFCE